MLVVDPGGYVGESTTREIAYARATGTPVAFTSQPTSESSTTEAVRSTPSRT